MAYGTPWRAAMLWLATLPAHRAEARQKSNCRPAGRHQTSYVQPVRISFPTVICAPTPQRSRAGLSPAGPYHFQPECAFFETNKAPKGQKEAAGENDAAPVSASSASRRSPNRSPGRVSRCDPQSVIRKIIRVVPPKQSPVDVSCSGKANAAHAPRSRACARP